MDGVERVAMVAKRNSLPARSKGIETLFRRVVAILDQARESAVRPVREGLFHDEPLVLPAVLPRVRRPQAGDSPQGGWRILTVRKTPQGSWRIAIGARRPPETGSGARRSELGDRASREDRGFLACSRNHYINASAVAYRMDVSLPFLYRALMR